MDKKIIDNELISVIVPTFNEAENISKTIKCLQMQTYSNLEIIIVDDNSTDDTCDIVQRLILNDNRIKLIKKNVNSGPAVSLNRGIEQSSSKKYIIRMDADDLIFPSKIERQFYYMESNPDIVCSGTSAYYINYKTDEHRMVVFPSEDHKIRKLLKFSDFIQSGSIIYRKESLFQVGLFDEMNPKGESMRMTLKLSKIGKLGNITSPEYVYFTRKGNSNRSADGNYKRRNLAYSEIIKTYAKENKSIISYLSSFGWSIFHLFPRYIQIKLRNYIFSEVINIPISAEDLKSIEEYYNSLEC